MNIKAKILVTVLKISKLNEVLFKRLLNSSFQWCNFITSYGKLSWNETGSNVVFPDWPASAASNHLTTDVNALAVYSADETYL